MFVQITSFESLNLLVLLPNLFQWCIILSQIVLQKDRFAVFKAKVTVKEHMVKIMTIYYVFWTADPFASKVGLVAHHHKLDYLVKRLDGTVVVKVTERLKIQWMFIWMISPQLLNLL